MAFVLFDDCGDVDRDVRAPPHRHVWDGSDCKRVLTAALETVPVVDRVAGGAISGRLTGGALTASPLDVATTVDVGWVHEVADSITEMSPPSTRQFYVGVGDARFSQARV